LYLVLRHNEIQPAIIEDNQITPLTTEVLLTGLGARIAQSV